MLNRFPSATPSLEDMLHDIGNPKPDEVAKALRVSTRTVRRWRADGNAPRPVMLAIFWLTRWGMSLIECEAINLAQLHIGLQRCTREQLEQARAAHVAAVTELEMRLELLVRIGDFGAANDPAPTLRRDLSELPVIAVPGETPPPTGAPGSTGTNHRKTNRFHRAG